MLTIRKNSRTHRSGYQASGWNLFIMSVNGFEQDSGFVAG